MSKPTWHIIERIDEGTRVLKLGENPKELTIEKLATVLGHARISLGIHSLTRRSKKSHEFEYPLQNYPNLRISKAEQWEIEFPRQWLDIQDFAESLNKLGQKVTLKRRPDKFFVIQELEGHKDLVFKAFTYGWVLVGMDGLALTEFDFDEVAKLRMNDKLIQLGSWVCPVTREKATRMTCDTSIRKK